MPDTPAEELPQPLIDGLKAADCSPAVITATVDRAVGEMARSHFRGRRPAWRRQGAWAAMAASVALAAVLVVGRGPFGGAETTPYADIDGSGRIDIADVLALARQGGLDQAELDAFASAVVALDAGGST